MLFKALNKQKSSRERGSFSFFSLCEGEVDGWQMEKCNLPTPTTLNELRTKHQSGVKQICYVDKK